MENDVNNRGVKLSVKIYGYLLTLYPPEYRREFGPAMIQLFRDQCRDAWRAAAGWGLAGLWLRTLPDLAKSSIVEQFSVWKKRSAFVRAFAVAFFSSMACAAILANLFPVPYSSTVKIYARRNPGNDPNFYLTQCKIIESYALLTNAITKLNLPDKLAKQHHEAGWTIDQTFDYLAHKISIKLHRETGIIDLSVENTDPILAMKMAEVIARIYCYQTCLNATKTTRSKLAPYEDAITIAKDKLSQTEGALFDGSASAPPKLKDLHAADEIAFSNYHAAVQAFGDAKLSFLIKNETTAITDGAASALPVMGTMKVVLICLGAGTLVALIAGSMGAWISLVRRKVA